MKAAITLLVLFALVLVGTAQTNAPPVRVALVATWAGETNADLSALATAGLSKETSVAMVERDQVERVFQEQQLSKSGLIDTRQAMTVGKLLGVEVFAALENLPGDQNALGLVVFDAATGVKLSDLTVNGSDVATKADRVKAAVLSACAKRQLRTSTLRTLCLFSVRNADMPREMDSLCESAGRLLERRLVQSPDVTVLERERLEEINRERQMRTGTPTNDLLASLTLLDLEFGKSPAAAEFKATAFLSDAGGGVKSKVSVIGNHTNVAELMEQLLALLTKQLAVAPVERKLDRAQEAARFHREAQFLVNHDYFFRGLEAAEAACALEPANEVYQQTLAASLVQAALSLLHAAPVVPPAGADRAAVAAPPELLRSVKLMSRAATLQKLDVMNYMRRAAPFEGGSDAETRKAFATFLQQFRDEILRNERVTGVTNTHSFQQLTYWAILHALPNLQYLSPTAREWTSDSVELISRWLEFVKEYPLSWDTPAGPPYYFGGATAMPVNRLLAWPFVRTYIKNPNGNSPSARWTLGAADYARWNSLYESMQRHPAPGVQIYGKIGRLVLDLRSTGLTTNEVVHRAKSIQDDVKQILNELPPDSASSLRRFYYRTALDAIDAPPSEYMSRENRWKICTQLMDSMLERREVFTPVVVNATHGWAAEYEVRPAPWVSPRRREGGLLTSFTPALLQNLERVEAFLGFPDVRLLDTDQEDFQKLLAGIRREFTGLTGLERTSELPTPRTKANLRRRTEPAGQESTLKPWKEARLVFAVRENLESINQVVIHGDAAYLVRLGWSEGGRFIQLVNVNIPDGQVRLLGKTQYDWPDVNNLGAIVTGACAHEGEFFVGTRAGLFVFPLDGGPPQHLTTTNGLPSNWVRSVACMDNKLFLGLGEHEGFLVARDLQSRRWDVIASSRRKEKRSPFDDTSPPFTVYFMRSDPPRQRVIALVSAPTAPGGKSLAGFWQINPRSGELSQLLELPGLTTWWPPNWLSPIRNDRLLLHQFDPRCVIDFDLRNDEAKLLYARDRFPSRHPLQPTEETVTTWINRCAPFLLVDGSLWTGDKFGRISRAVPNGESFAALPGERLPRTANCMSGIEPVGNGRQLLIAKKTQVWLVTLPEESAKVKSP